ncbi:MAG: ferritin-like domain-containing protein [Jatrophihabitantaceae bacterium]
MHGQLDEVSEPVAMDALNHRWALASPADFTSDIDVLNYALTLEYLEATFYQQGNARGLLSGQAQQYLAGVQKDEETHVQIVSQTVQKLGGTPVAKPKVNFDGVFASKDKYLTTSFTFENVGVGAYLGAAGYIKNKAVLQAAAGIFGVEARHAAIVANLLNKPAEGGVYMGAFETAKTKAEVLQAVAPFLPSQMSQMPGGAPNTGGGSTAGVQDSGLFAAGGAALLGGAGLAAYLATRRDDAEAATPSGGE